VGCRYPHLRMPAPHLSLLLRWSQSKVFHPLTDRMTALVSRRSVHVNILLYKLYHMETYHSLAFFHIDLVAYHDLYSISNLSKSRSKEASIQMGKSQDPSGSPVSGTHPSSYPRSQNSLNCSHHIPEHSNPRLDKTPHLDFESVLALLYPISIAI
jgi:hypothetical protein